MKTRLPLPAAWQLSPARGLGAAVNGTETVGDQGPPSFTALPWPAGAELERLENFHFHSKILPEDRTISVHLPIEYAREPERRFPVLYLQDGQNLFDNRTAYVPGHTWRAGTTADSMAATGAAEPLILVGIGNTGLRRMAEYTPTRDARMGGGEGDRYGRLLVEELKPWVDARYRTEPEAARTGLGGSSLGGLISLYLGLKYPDVFTRLAVLSPSLWWDQRSILAYVAEAARPKPPLRIWLDIGTAEGLQHVQDTELLAERLVGLGWREGKDLAVTMVEGGLHTEDAWADRLERVLGFLYPPRV